MEQLTYLIDRVQKGYYQQRSANDSSRYRVFNVIGQGTYGIVHKARDKSTMGSVAIKKAKLSNFQLANAEVRQEEVNYGKVGRHQNVTHLIGSYEEKISLGMRKCLVIDFMDKSMRDLLRDAKKEERYMEVDQIQKLAFQVLRGLNFLHHSKNLVHLDIKPENLLVNSTNHLKITDLAGINHPRDVATPRLITVFYRPPEVELETMPYSTKADVWSTGAVVAECLMGSVLFSFTRNSSLMEKIVTVLGTPTKEDANAISPSKPLTLSPKASSLSKMMDDCEIPAIGQDFVKALLVYDPNKRPSAFEAMASFFFDSLRKDTAHRNLFAFEDNEVTGHDPDVITSVVPAHLITATIAQYIARQRGGSQ